MSISILNAKGYPDPTAKAALDNAIREEKKSKKLAMIKITTTIPPSVNHAYFTTKGGKRILTDTAKDWIKQAGQEAFVAMNKHRWEYSMNNKLVMELWAFWPDRHRRDIHNLHKLIADAFEGILYKDDKMLLIRDMDFSVDKKRPRVEIVIREA